MDEFTLTPSVRVLAAVRTGLRSLGLNFDGCDACIKKKVMNENDANILFEKHFH